VFKAKLKDDLHIPKPRAAIIIIITVTATEKSWRRTRDQSVCHDEEGKAPREGSGGDAAEVEDRGEHRRFAITEELEEDTVQESSQHAEGGVEVDDQGDFGGREAQLGEGVFENEAETTAQRNVDELKEERELGHDGLQVWFLRY
jgi:hypothetical protein